MSASAPMVSSIRPCRLLPSHWNSPALATPTETAAKSMSVRFLVPSRNDYGFQVQRLRSENIDGVTAEVFRLRLSGLWGSFLLRSTCTTAPRITNWCTMTDCRIFEIALVSD